MEKDQIPKLWMCTAHIPNEDCGKIAFERTLTRLRIGNRGIKTQVWTTLGSHLDLDYAPSLTTEKLPFASKKYTGLDSRNAGAFKPPQPLKWQQKSKTHPRSKTQQHKQLQLTPPKASQPESAQQPKSPLTWSVGIAVALLRKPLLHGKRVARLSPQHGEAIYNMKAERPRACIVHSNRVNCSLIPLLCNDDSVAGFLTALTEKGKKSCIIYSTYLPGDDAFPPHAPGDVVAYCVDKGLQLIISSDANAHHTVWDSTNINQSDNKGTSSCEEIVDRPYKVERISYPSRKYND
ncbi:hypothetical protein JTB14_008273 [Gonioctena quinquepunctata]|nr:hypothetical protein JTB14_008273 [Gonioctena quinquepunctata]